MKVTVEIDCTPVEMRAFFGLPDVEPLQQAVMGRMEEQMLEAMDQMSPATLMRDWFAPMTASRQAFVDAFTRLNTSAPASSERGEEPRTSGG